MENSSASRPGEAVLLPHGLEGSPALAARPRAFGRELNLSVPALPFSVSCFVFSCAPLHPKAPFGESGNPFVEHAGFLTADFADGADEMPAYPRPSASSAVSQPGDAKFKNTAISPDISENSPPHYPDTSSGNSGKPNQNAKIAGSRPVSSEIRSEIPFSEQPVRKIPAAAHAAALLRSPFTQFAKIKTNTPGIFTQIPQHHPTRRVNTAPFESEKTHIYSEPVFQNPQNLQIVPLMLSARCQIPLAAHRESIARGVAPMPRIYGGTARDRYRRDYAP